MTCPRCGCDSVVDKATAWDAANAVPPHAAQQLTRMAYLELVATAARNMVNYDYAVKASNDLNEPDCISVPAFFMHALRDAVLKKEKL